MRRGSVCGVNVITAFSEFDYTIKADVNERPPFHLGVDEWMKN